MPASQSPPAPDSGTAGSSAAAPDSAPSESLPPESAQPEPSPPRWRLVAAWSTGPAAIYALLSLAHAALVERVLTVDVGFGRSLAFWVLSAYLALGLWGFLPRRPRGRYARRGAVTAALTSGLLGLLACGGFTVAWLVARWNASVAVPVLASLAAMLVAALATLWVADKTEARE